MGCCYRKQATFRGNFGVDHRKARSFSGCKEKHGFNYGGIAHGSEQDSRRAKRRKETVGSLKWLSKPSGIT